MCVFIYLLCFTSHKSHSVSVTVTYTPTAYSLQLQQYGEIHEIAARCIWRAYALL